MSVIIQSGWTQRNNTALGRGDGSPTGAANSWELDQRTLKTLITYDPFTGEFRWLPRLGHSHSIRPWANKIWNKRFAGKLAGSWRQGYRIICIMGVNYPAHRLAWLYIHGAFPPGEVDHISHDRSDNRLENLRVVSTAQNAKNRKLYCGNRTGTPGVRFDESRGKWIALISHSGRRHNLGRYETLHEAVAARKAAEVKFGYHANHGAPL